ncbi:hypothetical protein COCMIDRAFT_41255 [Bipolaris oryzae ATCC 44560]|uniref:Agmatinase n=1 Tax=Bipolaris oryzae ATCC 44560 TaxID=930090 RepID=W6Z9M3_COCMI|nr:uncharacterized protein COCMIDRAFT_41255 [Bipolaris oryzae ATCC 44560]EUC40401.1 hypothetical protein COCMIDRAFT_41255 [Bipolaris oryzae ATCC 44560]
MRLNSWTGLLPTVAALDVGPDYSHPIEGLYPSWLCKEKKGRSYNTVWEVNPFEEGLAIVDCGDVPFTPFDAAHVVKRVEQGYRQVLYHPTSSANSWEHPRIISLGGDNSITLPILRSLKTVYGSISVIHLDSHLDTWDPYQGYTGIRSNQSALTHGTFFWHASRKGCISKRTSVHGSLRTKPFASALTLHPKDYEIERDVGFGIIEAHEIDDIDMNGIIAKTLNFVKDTPAYLSIDIDVLDPSIAPATGTPEFGGWTTRELKRFIRGLEGINLFGVDVVEVSPPYDTAAKITSIAAADLIVDIMAAMAKSNKGPALLRVKEEL